MPRNVIIVGMARSGTSLTAAALARRGYHVGGSSDDHIQHGDAHNPFGYFEADDVITANVELLRRAGYRAHNTWLFERLSREQAEQIGRLEPSEEHQRLVRNYDERAPWLWKDPRLCFTLGYWWKLLDGRDEAVLLVERAPEDVYRSFRRMGWCPPGKAAREELLERIDDHVRAARSTVKALAIRSLTVHYGEARRAPDLVASRISEFCEIDISGEDLNVRPDLDHSGPRGRASTYVRFALRKVPARSLRRLEGLLPPRLVAAVFPERGYVDRSRSQREAEPGRHSEAEDCS